jgi:tetratricopeptide (TPR) repeat protein
LANTSPGSSTSLAAADPAPSPRARADRAHLLAAGIVALVAVVLTVLAFAHPVGDYYAETDFYGGYAPGARALLEGRFDVTRYGVVGPGYEVALALVGTLVGDLWRAGLLVSGAALCGALWLWFRIVQKLGGSPLGLWTLAFLAVDRTVLRMGYSVTTDALAFFLVTAALHALLVTGGWTMPIRAAGLAGLAMLTRYSAVALLPVAIVCLLTRGAPRGSRWRHAGVFLAALAIVAGPWIVVSAGAGVIPGGQLFHNVAFHVYAGSRGVTWDDYQAVLQPEFGSLADVIRREPGAVATRLFANLVDHLRLDASRVLGWPLAVAALIGLAVVIVRGRWRSLGPLGAYGAAQYLVLLPAIHADRYSLPLIPVYLTLVAAAGTVRWPRLRTGVWTSVLLAGLLAISLLASIERQRSTLDQLPREILPAARALRDVAAPGQRVMARKGHLGWHSGLETAPFPAVERLAELADASRTQRADYLYYSWVEANTRPHFWYLLDTSLTVPGLRLVTHLPEGPAALYRIEPGFGAEPGWMDDPRARAEAMRRAPGLFPESWAWRVHLSLALFARDRGLHDEALPHLERVTTLSPKLAVGWRLYAESAWWTGHAPEAMAAWTRVLELQPDNLPARVGLARAYLAQGDWSAASALCRPVIEQIRDRELLEWMAVAFERTGDPESAERARRRWTLMGG